MLLEGWLLKAWLLEGWLLEGRTAREQLSSTNMHGGGQQTAGLMSSNFCRACFETLFLDWDRGPSFQLIFTAGAIHVQVPCRAEARQLQGLYSGGQPACVCAGCICTLSPQPGTAPLRPFEHALLYSGCVFTAGGRVATRHSSCLHLGCLHRHRSVPAAHPPAPTSSYYRPASAF